MSYRCMCSRVWSLIQSGAWNKGETREEKVFVSVAVVAERDSSYGGLIARARSLRPHLDSPLLSSRPPCLHRGFPGNLSSKNLFNFLTQLTLRKETLVMSRKSTRFMCFCGGEGWEWQKNSPPGPCDGEEWCVFTGCVGREWEILSPLMSRVWRSLVWLCQDEGWEGEILSLLLFRGLRRLMCMFHGEGWEWEEGGREGWGPRRICGDENGSGIALIGVWWRLYRAVALPTRG